MKKAFWQLHFAIFLAGFTGILGRLITLNEGWLVFYRMLFTSIALWVIYFFSRRFIKVSRRELLSFVVVGGIIALHWVFFYGSIKYANVSIALVCFSAVGFFTALLEPLFHRKRIDVAELLLGLFVIFGISLIFHFDPQYKTGIILGLISSLLAALFTVMNKRLLEVHSAQTLTLYEMSGGCVLLGISLPLYLHYFPTDHLFPTWNDFGWLMVLSLFCTVLAFNLSLQALKKISAFTVNLSYNLEPIYGILLAFAVYQENKYLGYGFYAGFLVIVLSVVFQSLRLYKKSEKLIST